MIKQLEENIEFMELHRIMLKWFMEKDKSPKDIAAFLTATWVGQMCLNGYTEDFIDKTLKYMKIKWEKHRLNRHSKGYKVSNE